MNVASATDGRRDADTGNNYLPYAYGSTQENNTPPMIAWVFPNRISSTLKQYEGHTHKTAFFVGFWERLR